MKPLLPPVKSKDAGKICVVIDLDETLVHSSFKVQSVITGVTLHSLQAMCSSPTLQLCSSISSMMQGLQALKAHYQPVVVGGSDCDISVMVADAKPKLAAS